MRLLITSLLGIIFLSTSVIPIAQAQLQEARADECVETLEKRVASEHRVFRAILFGNKKAEDFPVGTVVYETDGSSWFKTTESEWRSKDEGFEDVTHFNALIDQRSEMTRFFGTPPERKGIFETKRATTSELIPYIGSSLRAFQCRLYQLCEVVNKSKKVAGENIFPINAVYPGCAETGAMPSIPVCQINEKRPIADSTIIFEKCEDAVREMLNQEAEILNLVIQYDAAYRTLQQLAGSMDLFLQELNLPMTKTLQQATDLVGILGRIPCYLASCEAFPPPQN